MIDSGNMPESDEYKKMAEEQNEIYSTLRSELTESQKELFEEFIRLENDMHRIETEEAFAEGVTFTVGFLTQALGRQME